MCWNNFDPLRGENTFTRDGFTETFFSKILDRVTAPVNEKYNNEFTNEESEESAYEWNDEAGSYSSEYEGEETDKFTSKECYKWFDEEEAEQESCYNDSGLLDKFISSLPWGKYDDEDKASSLLASISMLVTVAMLTSS